MNWETATRAELLAELNAQFELAAVGSRDRLDAWAHLELTATDVLRTLVTRQAVLCAHQGVRDSLLGMGADTRNVDRAIERLEQRARAQSSHASC